jgi:hypothetical protein
MNRKASHDRRPQAVCGVDETRRALDLGLFINGLPIATFELKNSLTKQTVEDAVEQYRRDRDPRERLFAFGRSHTARMAHDQALGKVMQLLLKDDTQVYKQFVENESFKRFVGDMVYALTSE